MTRYVKAKDVDVQGRSATAWVPESEISGEGGGGITNSAPINTIPVTTDGDGNLADSHIEYDDGAPGANRTITINTSANGSVLIETGGLGAQLLLEAADGDADHVGGEVGITSGNSDGSSGGQITIIALDLRSYKRDGRD